MGPVFGVWPAACGHMGAMRAGQPAGCRCEGCARRMSSFKIGGGALMIAIVILGGGVLIKRYRVRS